MTKYERGLGMLGLARRARALTSGFSQVEASLKAGEGKLLLSPASVDMGGLWAVPERKDFDALTPRMVQALYDELCMSRKELAPVFNGFAHYWENHQPI